MGLKLRGAVHAGIAATTTGMTMMTMATTTKTTKLTLLVLLLLHGRDVRNVLWGIFVGAAQYSIAHI